MNNGTFDEPTGDGIFKGKGISALLNSKNARNGFISLFNGTENIPSSVMRANRKSNAQNDDAVAQRSYNQTMKGRKISRNPNVLGIVRKAWTSSGKGVQSGALSTFPQNVGRSVLLLYSEPGQVVFDPFAGHNSRMDLCINAGRHYIGCDISSEFMRYNQKTAAKLREKYPQARIKLHHVDSRKVPVKDAIGDFTITSPPYYNIEYYGDEPEQLGKCPTYREFLHAMGLVIKENFRCLKPGAYAAWFINDFRQKGKMHFYHMDIIRLGKKAGFIAHDLMIVDLGRSIRDCFTAQMVKTKILPKRHEYAVIFRKPLQDG
jgi:SAM-dependent methyltransferase